MVFSIITFTFPTCFRLVCSTATTVTRPEPFSHFEINSQIDTPLVWCRLLPNKCNSVFLQFTEKVVDLLGICDVVQWCYNCFCFITATAYLFARHYHLLARFPPLTPSTIFDACNSSSSAFAAFTPTLHFTEWWKLSPDCVKFLSFFFGFTLFATIFSLQYILLTHYMQ